MCLPLISLYFSPFSKDLRSRRQPGIVFGRAHFRRRKSSRQLAPTSSTSNGLKAHLRLRPRHARSLPPPLPPATSDEIPPAHLRRTARTHAARQNPARDVRRGSSANGAGEARGAWDAGGGAGVGGGRIGDGDFRAWMVRFSTLGEDFVWGARLTFYFCSFWGAERKFWQTPGVYSTSVGYAAGETDSPTYYEVCSGRTGHAEVRFPFFFASHPLLHCIAFSPTEVRTSFAREFAHTGCERRVRPRESILRSATRRVLGRARPDDEEPTGERHRDAVPYVFLGSPSHFLQCGFGSDTPCVHASSSDAKQGRSSCTTATPKRSPPTKRRHTTTRYSQRRGTVKLLPTSRRRRRTISRKTTVSCAIISEAKERSR